jgi:hypothetical protein
VLKLFLLLLVLVTMVLPLQFNRAFAEKKVYGLQALDNTPLAERYPLLLIHGINPQAKIRYGWIGFTNHVQNKATFNDRYKTYLFVFSPADSVAENSRKLQQAVRLFLETEHPAKPLRFAALSLGGMLVQNMMEDETIREHTDRIVAIGVPFHGTPLANPAWIRAQLKEAPFYSPMRMSNRLAYWLTGKKFPTFEQDFCWDNFDGSMPESLIAKGPACSQHTTAGEEKYIVYAGFFGVKPEERAWLYQALNPSATPDERREQGGRLGKHGLFPFVQSSIAGLPLSAQPSIAGLPLSAQPEVRPETSAGFYPMTFFNDGISPISSQLWLGRFVKGTPSNPVALFTEWQAVFEMSSTQKARLFEGLDHRDWLEGNTRVKDEGALLDLLHSDLSRRNIFDWLEYDLMRD